MGMGASVFNAKVVLSSQNKAGDAFKRAGKEADGFSKKLADVGKAAAIAGAAMAAAFGVNAIKKMNDFGKAVGDLAAITGASGQDLDKLSNASKRLGATTTLSATQAAEAFKLVASAKPELLKNNDALIATTESAVLLAEAAGIELPEAAIALGGALNQFGKGAEYASEAVDILASSSQLGSAEVSEVSEALKNVGPQANLMGISMKDTAALIEAMAASNIKGADAGTKLNTMLIALETQANDKFNPAVVGITQALRNLRDANLSATDKMALFQKRGMSGFNILMQQQGLFEELTSTLGKSGTAADQARARFDNLNGDVLRMLSSFEYLSITVGERYTGALRDATTLSSAMFLVLADGQSKLGEISGGFGVVDWAIRAATTAVSFFTGGWEILVGSFTSGITAIKALMEGDLEGAMQAGAENASNFVEVGRVMAENFSNIWSEDVRTKMQEGFENNVNAPLLAALDALDAEIANRAATAGEEAATAAAEKEREAFERKLEALQENLASEREILETERLERAEIIQEALEEGLLNDEAAKELAYAAEAKYQNGINSLVKKGLTQRQQFEQMATKLKVKTVLGGITELTQGVATSNKAMFNINKAAALANAIVSLPSHVANTMKQYPYPISIAMGALAAAASIAQISAIKSTSFEGGGTGTTPSAVGTVPTINDQPFGRTDAPSLSFEDVNAPSEKVIVVEGLDTNTAINADTARAVIEGIGEAIGDGATVRFR